MSSSSPLQRAFLAAALSLVFGSVAASADVRVHGATTVAFGLMKRQKEKIEALAGTAIVLLPSSTTRGLTDLAQGRADIAMLAEPLDDAARSINDKTPGTVDTGVLVSKHVGNAYVQFIVHPGNPVRNLSKAQLAGLFSGKIRNWSEVGGADQQVLLVGEPTSAPHKLIGNALGITFPGELRVVQNTNQTALIVAQAPGALSYITTAHDLPERSRLKEMATEVKVPLELYLAYRKDAPKPVTSVVEAAASLGE
jgi:phosphate transport system substrate-binding protein